MTNTKKDTLIRLIRDFAMSRDYYLNYGTDNPFETSMTFYFHRYPNPSDILKCEIMVVWDELKNVFDAFENIKKEVDYQMRNNYIPPQQLTVKWEPKLTKETMDYIKNDITSTQKLVYDIMNRYNKVTFRKPYAIEKVVFNGPATIVFWADKTKTVVKCGDRDIYDPEKGLAMAIVKKALGNQGNYYNEIKKWLPEETEEKHGMTALYLEGMC